MTTAKRTGSARDHARATADQRCDQTNQKRRVKPDQRVHPGDKGKGHGFGDQRQGDGETGQQLDPQAGKGQILHPGPSANRVWLYDWQSLPAWLGAWIGPVGRFCSRERGLLAVKPVGLRYRARRDPDMRPAHSLTCIQDSSHKPLNPLVKWGTWPAELTQQEISTESTRDPNKNRRHRRIGHL